MRAIEQTDSPKVPGIDKKSKWLIAALLAYCFTKTPFYLLDIFSRTEYAPLRPILGYVFVGIAWLIRPPRLAHPILATLGALSCLSILSKMINAQNYAGYLIVIPNYSDSVMFGLSVVSLAAEEVRSLFSSYRNTIVALVLPAFLLLFAIGVGIKVPYAYVSLGDREAVYRSYFGLSIFTDATMTSFGPFVLARLCGPFEEPGMLGTIIAFILVADYILEPTWGRRKLILVAAGLFSQSLAFTVILIAVVLAHLVRRKMIRTIAGFGFVCSAIIAGYSLLPGEFRAVIYSNYVERMEYDFDAGRFNDRSRAGFQERFIEYCRTASAAQLAVGNGWSANQRNADAQYSTAHSIIYDSGFVGFFLVCGFVGYYYIYEAYKVRKAYVLILGTACVASFYQRPDVMGVYSWLVVGAILSIGAERRGRMVPLRPPRLSIVR